METISPKRSQLEVKQSLCLQEHTNGQHMINSLGETNFL